MNQPVSFRLLAGGLIAVGSLGCTAVLAAGSPWAKPASGADSLLPADQAFQLVSAERSADQITISWAIAPGYYLYRKRLGFEVLTPTGARLEAPLLPKGERVADEREGTTEVYRTWLKAKLPMVSGSAPVEQLRVSYQGCADAGVCYPPVNVSIDVTAASR